MSMDISQTPNKVESLFNKLEQQRTILTKCTTLYKTLISQFNSLDRSISLKSQSLDSRSQSLDSNSPQLLDDLQRREDSIPDRLASLIEEVESRKKLAFDEFEKPQPGEDASLSDALKNVCRKMDHSGLLKVSVARRKEANAMRVDMPVALLESVDPPRLVLETVREFVRIKEKKVGLTDKRRACANIVVGLFPPEELVAKRQGGGARGGPEYSKAVVGLAEEVVKEWKETADKIVARGGRGVYGGGDDDNGERTMGMGPAEASMFLLIVLGFGLMDKFDETFYKKLIVEFPSRRDMPKIAIALFGDKIGDIIEEVVKNGKQVDAVYFATETGLTERFQPVPLLKAGLETIKSNVASILRKGNRSRSAYDEANTYEIISTKFFIKCVEDHNLESEFPLENLRKHVATLEKAKADKKAALTTAPKPSNKRVRTERRRRPPPRHAKFAKFSGPPPPYGQRSMVPPPQPGLASGYPPPYSSYPTYDSGHNTAATLTYGQGYGGGSYIPPSAQAAQQQYATAAPQHYGVPGDGVGGTGGQYGGPYGAQAGYGSYSYSAAAPPTYRPS